MTLANQQYLSATCRRCRSRHIWSWCRSWRCVTLSGCRHSHTFQCLSDPISFNTCSSGPVLSGTGSIMTTATTVMVVGHVSRPYVKPAARVWNTLSPDVRSSSSLSTFKRQSAQVRALLTKLPWLMRLSEF